MIAGGIKFDNAISFPHQSSVSNCIEAHPVKLLDSPCFTTTHEKAPKRCQQFATVSTDQQPMIEIAGKVLITIIGTAIYISAMYFTWTKHIDVYRTLIRPIESIIQTNNYSTVNIEENNILLIRYKEPLTGSLAMIFYNSIKFINLSDKAVTIKEIHLRFKIAGSNKEIELSNLQIGRAGTPDGPS